MQIFSWMTWALSLALAVGGVLNISASLDLQTEVMTWQQKYVVIIAAAWPLYVAFALALIAGIGATIEVYINTMPTSSMSRVPSPVTSRVPRAAAPVSHRRSAEDSLEHDFERVSQSTPHQMVNLYDAVQSQDANTMAVSQTVPIQEKSPQQFGTRKQAQQVAQKKEDELEFFRMD